ncbi:hypothetical protein F5Y13DRAFT_176397 [Hypoxylon sp. FL1857]|nr:hypothetical protein F5Y13DRAFT_176397 [Hypoxylon sp. FL1857]
MTALHLAASLGYDDVVVLLLDYGADINALSQGFCGCNYRLGNDDSDKVKPWWMPLHTAIVSVNQIIQLQYVAAFAIAKCSDSAMETTLQLAY